MVRGRVESIVAGPWVSKRGIVFSHSGYLRRHRIHDRRELAGRYVCTIYEEQGGHVPRRILHIYIYICGEARYPHHTEMQQQRGPRLMYRTTTASRTEQMEDVPPWCCYCRILVNYPYSIIAKPKDSFTLRGKAI